MRSVEKRRRHADRKNLYAFITVIVTWKKGERKSRAAEANF
jgi:hypothetical protein